MTVAMLNSGAPGKLHPSYAVKEVDTTAAVDTTATSETDTTVASGTDTTGASRVWGSDRATGNHLQADDGMGRRTLVACHEFVAGAGSKLYGFYLHVFHSPAAVFYQARGGCGLPPEIDEIIGNVTWRLTPSMLTTHTNALV